MSRLLPPASLFHTPPPPIVPPTSPQVFAFVSPGDVNGVLDFIGRDLGVAAWTNPHTAGRVVVTRSSSLAGTDAALVNRATGYNTTGNDPGEWVAIDLGGARTLVVTDYTLQNGAADGANAPFNWTLQGSDDGSTWDDLDVQTSNTDIAQTVGAWGAFALGSTPASYSHFRFLATGVNQAGLNYLQISEIELYGTLTF